VAATTPPQPPPKITIRFRPLRYAISITIEFLSGLICVSYALTKPDRKPLQIAQPLITPHRLFRPSLERQLLTETRRNAQKPEQQSIGNLFEPFHKTFLNVAVVRKTKRSNTARGYAPSGKNHQPQKIGR
jgi:hypothetical protein